MTFHCWATEAPPENVALRATALRLFSRMIKTELRESSGIKTGGFEHEKESYGNGFHSG